MGKSSECAAKSASVFVANVSCSQRTFDLHDSMRRNRLSNVSFFVCSVGEIIVLAILAGILYGIDAVNNNTRALSVVCAYSAGVWILCAAPWLIWEQYRPGYKLPPATSYLLVGFKQLYHCFRLCMRLKQTFIYLAGYFLLGDCLNTTVTVSSRHPAFF